MVLVGRRRTRTIPFSKINLFCSLIVDVADDDDDDNRRRFNSKNYNSLTLSHSLSLSVFIQNLTGMKITFLRQKEEEEEEEEGRQP